MAILTTICIICYGEFRSSDVIQSTFCGHIFHKFCLEQLKSKSKIKSCPNCRCSYPSESFAIQLFLELDDQNENLEKSENIKELKTKIQNAETENSKLQNRLKELQLNFQLFQEQVSVAQQEFEIQIKDHLKQSIHELSTETKEKSKELNLKNIETSKLKNNPDNDAGYTDSALKSQIEILEQDVKDLRAKLEKEIAYSKSLMIEILELKGFKNVKNNNYLLITFLQKKEITLPLEDAISIVGAKLGLDVSHKDISKVRILEKSEVKISLINNINNITLLVEFKTNDMKIKYLYNKDQLNNYLSRPYVLQPLGDDVHSLLIYTNEKLKNSGFFTEIKMMGPDHKGQKYISATDKTGQIFLIQSIQNVEDLLKRSIQESTFNDEMTKKGLQII